MENPQLELEVQLLKEEVKELKKSVEEFEKNQINADKTYASELRNMLVSIREFLDWKSGIDEIIEKIKKILPI